ncbi:unnamed protein product [Calypogeia fissa]
MKEATKDNGVEELLNNLMLELQTKKAFKIYGGFAGLYDYGPPGCAIKANVLALWRQHFVLEEGMLEVDCPCVTPKVVLKASGHVDKFTDLMVKDLKTSDPYRADHLLKGYIEDTLEKEDSLPVDKRKELQEIGPAGNNPGFLRPETAQGNFVNFNHLYNYNGSKLPFAVAQIDQAFRNEVAPRQGLLRVQEFTLVEIEHFVDPDDKSHPKFKEAVHLKFLLYPREATEAACHHLHWRCC